MSIARLFSFAKRKVHTSTYQNTFKEVYIPVPWGTIAGKWWGSTNTKPILCFHGIQDNCGTFDRLIPTLNGNAGISFLCLDFPGHGYSSPFPKGMFYDFLSYPILIKRICEYFNWLTISLMGHSLGAIVSFVYTMLYPEKVNFLMCIDALKPIHNPMSAEEIRRSIDNFLKYEKFGEINEPLTYTLEEMIQKIANKNSVNSEYVPFILKRNISVSKKDPSKYYFIRDPVVKLRIMFNWPQEQLVKDASRITCPVLICKSKQISYFEPKENFNRVLDVLKGSSIDCVFHILDGTHHLHLNEPQTIGDLIKYFLNKHYTPEKIHLNENDTVFCKSRCNSQSTKI